MEGKKVLFCDIDDVLIKSSPFIQKYVNNKTIFKTEVLITIEQLIRNCQYYVDLVEDECFKARNENRKPNLDGFPNFNLINYDFKSCDKNKLYDEIVNYAKYYLSVANMILNQFLEERDMFLELDNLPYGESKEYNYELESKGIEKFKSILKNNYNAFENINDFCLREVVKISENAKKQGILPNYGALVKMDSNDIIRTTTSNKNFEYYMYEKPCSDVEKCITNKIIDYALNNFDIKRSESCEIVDYNAIYTVDNANMDAVIAIKKAMLKGEVDELCFITHHNGLREENAKRKFINKLFLNAKFLGLRFHSEEHNLVRRYRSSKFLKASDNYDLIPKNMILLDDSKDNCSDWEKNGGTSILYREVTDAEKTSEIEVFPYQRITTFDCLEEAINSVIEKQKVKERK